VRSEGRHELIRRFRRRNVVRIATAASKSQRGGRGHQQGIFMG